MEIAIILFAVLAPSLAVLYLAIYVSHRRRQWRAARPELSLLDVIGRQ
jgi:hypothetical protein